MPATLEALVILVVAVAPGLLFELGLERQQSYRRTPTGDRILRFVSWSLLLHAAAFPFTRWLWVHHLRDVDWKVDDVPLWPLYVGAIVYAFVPLALGAWLGSRRSLPSQLRDWILGPHQPPRAWDEVFNEKKVAYVRVCLRDGTWLAGTWAYTSSFPAPEDLLLDRLQCDPGTGALTLDDAGHAVPIGSRVLVTATTRASSKSNPHE